MSNISGHKSQPGDEITDLDWIFDCPSSKTKSVTLVKALVLKGEDGGQFVVQPGEEVEIITLKGDERALRYIKSNPEYREVFYKIVTVREVRDLKRERLRHQGDLERQVLEANLRPGSEEEIIAAARNTIMGFLHNRTPKPFTLREAISATAHIPSSQRRIEVPEGTEGWLYHSVDRFYDRYVDVGDWELPAKGAKVVREVHWFHWVCLTVDHNGAVCFVELQRDVEKIL